MLTKTDRTLTEKNTLVALSICSAVYVLLYFFFCCLKYYGFDYHDFDLAIHDQIIWNILHGRIFNSILGTDFLGNHVHLICFLVAPLYWFVPHPLFLLFLQTFFLAAGVFPLYAISRLYLDHRTSFIIGIIYLLYPGLGYTNLFEYHPTCYVPFFLLCTAYYFYKEKFFLFNVFMFLSLICQENIALVFIMWGVYSFVLRREWKWVLWPSCLGTVYFLLCVYVILPDFNKNTFNFFEIYGPLGKNLGEVLKTCVTHPVFVTAFILKPYKLHFLGQLFLSVAFIPFFSPLAILPAFLLFIQHLLSTRISEMSLQYHYTAEIIPFIFISFVFGIKKIIRFKANPKFLAYFLLLNAVIMNFLLGPHLQIVQKWKHVFIDQSVVEKEELLQEIPEHAPVVATFEFLTHLSHRQRLYSFHHVYSGYYTLFTKAYQLPENVQYALIDFNDYLTFFGFYNPANYRNVYKFLAQGQWGSVDVKDSMVLFKKGVTDRFPLVYFLKKPVVAKHPAHLVIDGRIELTGYNESVSPDRIHLILYWKSLKFEQKDVNLFIDLIDENGNIIGRQYRPMCYRIWPTQAWRPGQMIEVHQYISMTPDLKGRVRYLKIGFYDLMSEVLVATDRKYIMGTIKINLT